MIAPSRRDDCGEAKRGLAGTRQDEIDAGSACGLVLSLLNSKYDLLKMNSNLGWCREEDQGLERVGLQKIVLSQALHINSK